MLVVSNGTAWRWNGIQKAANFTGFKVQAPTQPHWSTADIDEFRGSDVFGHDKTIRRGEARAWVLHLQTIYQIVHYRFATTLILEDDADWDISIKQQLSRVAPLIHQVTGSNQRSGESPYGDAWDLLWFGHCYDTIPSTIPASYLDETLPSSPLYRENSGGYTLFPQRLRMVYMSEAPACVYAYALTYSAATKINQLAREFAGHPVKKHISEQYRDWCKQGILQCVTVNPELFHDHKQAGELGSEVKAVEGLPGARSPQNVSYTPNIRYSAWCNSESAKLVTCQAENGDESSLQNWC